MAYDYVICPQCGVKSNLRESSYDTLRRCPNCGFKYVARRPPFSFGGCLSGIVVLVALALVVPVACCGLMGLIGSSVDSSRPPPTVKPKELWKAITFQDAGLDISSRSPKVQQAREQMLEIFFVNVAPPKNGTVTAELASEAREGWYADDVLRKNTAGMLYAYYFSDDKGAVVILDQGKQVGTYRWANGPQYADVAAGADSSDVAATDVSDVDSSLDDNKSLIEQITGVPPIPTGSPYRTFTSADGSYSVEGELVSYGAGKVMIRKPDGAIIQVPAVITADGGVTLVPPPAEKLPESPTDSPIKPESNVRTWTSADGKFKTEAEFQGSIAGKVKLRKTDGTIITIESYKLSEADQEWIRRRAR